MKLIVIYLLLINVLGCILMLADKRKAVKKRRRIPEATLMGVAFLGGSLGTLLGMRLFRHKTLHPKFSIGVPVLLALHMIAWIILLSTKTEIFYVG